MSAVSTLTLCWRIERRDGVTLGLSAHDRDVVVDGLSYCAAPGMTPSAIVRDDTLEAPAMTVEGALSHAAIRESDLKAGRYDGARVVVFAVDWERPGAPVAVASGRIGAVETGRGTFAAELLGGEVRLEAPVVEATSPGCRATLGDRRCRVAMRGRRKVVAVTRVEGDRVVLSAGAGFARGRLRWIGGANGGLSAMIVAADAEGVTLEVAPRFEGAGALVELSEGCDGTLGTCRDRFGKVANFRGEPHLPGIDLLTRYPGG